MAELASRRGSIDLDVIHVGDCLDWLPKLPDGCSTLVIADPPYNLGPSFGNERDWRRSADWLPWCIRWLNESKRVLADDGNLFVYGIHHYLCYLQVELYRLGMHYQRQIIWYYENGFATQRSLATHYEPILWFSKTKRYCFREIREPYKSTERLRHRITKNGRLWTPHPDGRRAGDVWRFPTLAGQRFKDERVAHPTQKPRALTDRIVGHFSRPGDLVVVPFAGSGTECVSARALGRRYWVVELNPQYAALAASRLASTQVDIESLLGPEP